MKILGVGLSKTGTASLSHALGMLGFNSIHYAPERMQDIILGTCRTPDFRRYDDVDAVTDLPAAFFYDELLNAYPDTRCILTVRDEDSWYASMLAHGQAHREGRYSKDSGQHDLVRRLTYYVFGCWETNEYLVRKKYRQHNERVLATIPSKMLLVMDIPGGDGWEVLCKFLDKPVPEGVAFPSKNQKDNWKQIEYLEEVRQELLEMTRTLPQFLLISDSEFVWDDNKETLNAIPFFSRSGVYFGKPPSEEAAVEELKAARTRGVRYVVFAYPALWWLHTYKKFSGYVRNNSSIISETQNLIVFYLN